MLTPEYSFLINQAALVNYKIKKLKRAKKIIAFILIVNICLASVLLIFDL
jgi:hypothetical protein